MSARDAQLTLSNTNEFFEMLDYEFSRASRYKNDVTLLFVKLGNINKIATDYGQLTAARILSKIERLIRDNIRSSDREFIYGNDEFMIIFPQTSKEGGDRIIPKLRELIERCSFTNGDELSVKIAPQFGIASYPHDALTKDGVVKLVNNIS